MPDPIHADLRRIAMVLPRGALGPRLLPTVRRLESLTMRRQRVPDGVEVVPVGEVSVRLHHPPAGGDGPFPALLWIHGGGYVMGSPAQDDRMCAVWARLGLVVAAVAYRRAPEHPFPTPLQDCDNALVWLSRRADVDASRLAIGGASAGGGLAAGLVLHAHDRGEVPVAAQLLSYPMLDDRTVLRTDIDEHSFRLWNNKSNRFGWQSYLGRAPGGADVDPHAAAGRREDLSGLPPAWIGVGTLDLFHDEDVAYAKRLGDAGVPCTLEEVPGAFHGFDAVRPTAGVSRRYGESMTAFLATQLGLPSSP
jgi:acetyl esterase/lipase